MLEELKSKWTDILNIMKADFDIADVSFKTWILPLEVYSYDNDTVTIIVPEKQTGLKIIEKRYTTPLKVTISEVMDHEVDTKFHIIGCEFNIGFTGIYKNTLENAHCRSYRNSPESYVNAFKQIIFSTDNFHIVENSFRAKLKYIYCNQSAVAVVGDVDKLISRINPENKAFIKIKTMWKSY